MKRVTIKFFVLLRWMGAGPYEGIFVLCDASCLPQWVVVSILSGSWNFSMVANSQLVVCDLRAQGGVL